LNLNSETGKGTIAILELIPSSDVLSLIVLVENADLDGVGGRQIRL